MFLKETATIAAYEGARVAVQKGVTAQDVRDRVLTVLADRGADLSALSGASPTTVTPDPATAPLLQPVTVSVRLPCAGNTCFPMGHIYGFMGDKFVQGQCIMVKEFDES